MSEEPVYIRLSDEDRERVMRKLERLIDLLPEGPDKRFAQHVHRNDLGSRREICRWDVPYLKELLDRFGIE